MCTGQKDRGHKYTSVSKWAKRIAFNLIICLKKRQDVNLGSHCPPPWNPRITGIRRKDCRLCLLNGRITETQMPQAQRRQCELRDYNEWRVVLTVFARLNT